MGRENLVSYVATVAGSCLKGNMPLEDMVLAAFRGGLKNGIVTGEADIFDGSLAAVLVALKQTGRTDEYDRVAETSRAIHAVEAALAAGILPDLHLPKDPVPIMALWHKANKEH